MRTPRFLRTLRFLRLWRTRTPVGIAGVGYVAPDGSHVSTFVIAFNDGSSVAFTLNSHDDIDVHELPVIARTAAAEG